MKVPPFSDVGGTDRSIQAVLSFGVALHYAIPREGFDCNLGPSGSQDLPPGQYVIPFTYSMENMINQQNGGQEPQVWVTGADGNQLQIAGQSGSLMTWVDDQGGSCSAPLLSAHGTSGDSARKFGVIGPATLDQLRHAIVYAAWGNEPSPDKAFLAKPLVNVLPNRALPGVSDAQYASVATAGPGLPTSCPVAPKSYPPDQQVMFNSACGVWVGQVGSILHDYSEETPAQAAKAWCDEYVNGTPTSDSSTTPAELMLACRAGVAAAGGPSPTRR